VKFEWDSKKASANLAKHGVSFEDASTVFGDPLAGTIRDPLQSGDEARFITMGHSAAGTLVVVVHSERGERARIISARLATSAERKRYESKSSDQQR
jgi:uncharacterized DUF497 family protein